MNIKIDLLHAQILAIDNPEIEELLREPHDLMRVDKKNSTRMTASWANNALWVRLDCINEYGALIRTVRVPMNDVLALKAELHRKGELEALIADIKNKMQLQMETLLALIEMEMFRR